MPGSEEPGSGPVIHDNRRIDPVTGQVRGRHAASKPAGTSGAGRPAGGASGADGGASGADGAEGQEAAGTAEEAEEVLVGTVQDAPVASAGQQAADAAARLAERTADLQRLQAEYANYRKRVERDRTAVKEQAIASALTGLLPVLDAIDQAREHGELSGGFKSVADSLTSAVSKLGLVAYGDKGDAFDPKIHEALAHSYSPDVIEDTCVEIFQPGYKVGDRILRPARVAVAEPATGPDGSSNESAESSDEEGN
jgi:molecular chaperone GrpE